MSKVVSLLAAAKRRRDEGNAPEAERLYRQVLTESPSNAAAARALGAMLLDAQRPADAAAVLSPAASARPSDPELQVLLGRSLYLTGQVPAAAQALEMAVQIDPGSYAGRLWLAKCRLASDRPAEAESLLRALLLSRPTDPLALAALGHACVGQGRRLEALEHFRAAARFDPSASSRSDLGYAYYIVERLDEALAEFDAALAMDPKLGAAAAGKAMVLTDRNQREEARRIVKAALDQGSLDTVLTTTYARLSTSGAHRPDARRAVENALGRPGLRAADLSPLLLALGSLKEADGEYDGAFECYREGNDLISSGFNRAAVLRSAQEVLAVFDRANMDRLPRNPERDPLPVFIVGMPRSGTSLVEQILASHPSVYGAGELSELAALAHRMPALLKLPGSASYPRCVLSMAQEHVGPLAKVYLDRLRGLGGTAERVTDKMPLNFVYLGLIDLLFPGARIIHCVRHPLDTCFSCYATPINHAHGYRTRLGDLVSAYQMYRRVMDGLRTVVRVPILDVRYEDVVAESERHSRRLVEFIGLPWDERCLRFHENARVARTSSNDQVRRPMYNSSVGRWKHFEGHLGELISGLREYCDEAGAV